MNIRLIGRGLILVAILVALLVPAASSTLAQTKVVVEPTKQPAAAGTATPKPKRPQQKAPGLEDYPNGDAQAQPEEAGGPDAFGYRYIDSNEAGGPNYSYINATNLVNGLHGGDDKIFTDTIPFPISIYGHQTTTATLSVNGHLHLNADFCRGDPDNGQCNWEATPLPSVDAPNGMIAPFWSDLDIRTTGDVYTAVVGTAPLRTYVVEWRNVDVYGTSNYALNFEVLFEEGSGDITFQYGRMTGNLSEIDRNTIGIQNLTRTVGLMYSQNQPASISEGLAVRFYLEGGTQVSTTTPAKNTAPGTTVTYQSSLLNKTGTTNSYNISTTDSETGFDSEVTPASSGSMTPNTGVPFTVTVSVPASATIGTVNVTTVNVDAANAGPSCPNNNCDVTVTLTTTVNTLGADITVPDAEGVGSAGVTVMYTATLFNRSGMPNTFDLEAVGETWQTVITPSVTSELQVDASTQILVGVTIPANADLGSRDTVTITARGREPEQDQFRGELVLTTVAGNWTTRGFMRTARSRHALVDSPNTGKVYALGGEGTDNNRDLPIEEFDPATGQWTAKVRMPVPVSNVGGASINGVIYVPGGYDGEGAVNLLQTYNPINNTTGIIVSDPLPAATLGAGVAAIGNKLYMVGGSNVTTTTAALWVYDPARPAESRWERKANMPTPRVFLAVAVLGGKLYALGGVPGITDLTDLDVAEVYDPATNAWSVLPPMEVPRGGGAAAGVNGGGSCGGFIYVVGGGWFAPTNVVERYSPAGGWEQLASMHQGRRNLGFAYSTVRGQLVAAGGYGTDYTGHTEVLGCGSQASVQPTASVVAGSPTATPPPGCSFGDVPQSFWGYTPITWLACRGMVSGYSDNTFRPFNNMTRGQIAKVVALGVGWPLVNPSTPTFDDVGRDNAFYQFIETAYANGVIQGYSDGTFRWSNNVTRGQIAKIVVSAGGLAIDTSGGPHFDDVLPGSTFYEFIETAYNRGIISGYADGTFRPGDNATRAQVAKVVYLTVR